MSLIVESLFALDKGFFIRDRCRNDSSRSREATHG